MAAGATLQGRRIRIDQLFSPDCQPGDYCGPITIEDESTAWYVCDPTGAVGRLTEHTVTEHEDGTISVTPSILAPGGWHGYLERGIWREV